MRITILAIDGMDRTVAGSLKKSLPHIKQLFEKNEAWPLISVFPPDTDTAWASFYTAMSPAEHGVMSFHDPLIQKRKQQEPVDDSFYQGRSLWDKAVLLNKRCCISLAHNIFPGWDINGVMLTRGRQSSNSGLTVNCIPPLMSIDEKMASALSSERMGPYGEGQFVAAFESMKERWAAESEAALRLHQSEKWDLFFGYFSVLDAVQHYFWRFYDSSHPDYIEGHLLEEAVLQSYQWADNLIGKFIENSEHSEMLMVISDHGHGKRPTNLFNLNEFLRRNGLLRVDNSSGTKLSSQLRMGAKRIISAYVSRFSYPALSKNFAALASHVKNGLVASIGIDCQKSAAYVLEMGSMKHYSYGGLRVNTKAMEKDAIVYAIMDGLAHIKIPNSDDALVKWMERRENLYDGEYIDFIPDIMLELDDDYGISSATNCPLFEKGYMHRIQSGSHKRLTPVLFIHNMSPENYSKLKTYILDQPLSFMNLHHYILSCLSGKDQL